MGLHNKVVKPNLVAGQTLSGFVINKVFSSKVLYLRPNKTLLQSPDDIIEKCINTSDHETEHNEGKHCIYEDSHYEMEHSDFEKQLQETSVFQMTNDVVIDRGSLPRYENYETTLTTLQDQLVTETEKTVLQSASTNAYSTVAVEENSQSSDPYHQYINILEVTEDDDIEGPIVFSDNSNDSSGDSFLLEDILQNLADVISEEESSIFNINRSSLWEGAVRGFKRNTYSPNKHMSIKFTDDVGHSEGAVDIGGPRREFLRLLMRYLQSSSLFMGPEHKKYLAVNSTAVRTDDYFIAGRAIAVCLVHGGPPPQFISTELYDALVSGPENVKCDFKNIEDEDIRSKLQKIYEAKTLGEASEAVLKFQDFLSLAGCLHRMISVECSKQIVEEATNWYFSGAQEEYLKDGDGDISLGQILAFATGTDYPPALGWTTKPSIEFIYSKDLFPTANTCANILRLPTVHNVYEDFKCNLDFAIQNSPGFGQT
ncbi:uncharacterized protein LOC120519898 [Polypterus senegalus]|uniref:uncharacterized protein LOC120519898 n=1 Tax=Polypterus senegalus TaxID=55291 RepID=UPI001963B5EB|nr:uncharacterized protein LOC120519898 [Polypterus senegalus]